MGTMIRAGIVVALLLIGGYVLMGGRPLWPGSASPSGAVVVPGAIDTQKARERGAELGEKAAAAAARVGETLEEAGVTTKIKAKMALDETVRARSIDVTTNGSTVTVHGTVRSVAEHDRAIALARETNGVTQVVDRLLVAR